MEQSELVNSDPRSVDVAQGEAVAKESNRKQRFYAVVKVPKNLSDWDVMTIMAENRTQLKKLVLEFDPIEVIAIFRGRKVDFETRTQVNFC